MKLELTWSYFLHIHQNFRGNTNLPISYSLLGGHHSKCDVTIHLFPLGLQYSFPRLLDLLAAGTSQLSPSIAKCSPKFALISLSDKGVSTKPQVPCQGRPSEGLSHLQVSLGSHEGDGRAAWHTPVSLHPILLPSLL